MCNEVNAQNLYGIHKTVLYIYIKKYKYQTRVWDWIIFSFLCGISWFYNVLLSWANLWTVIEFWLNML